MNSFVKFGKRPLKLFAVDILLLASIFATVVAEVESLRHVDGATDPASEILIRHASVLIVFRLKLEQFLKVVTVNYFVLSVKHLHKLVNR